MSTTAYDIATGYDMTSGYEEQRSFFLPDHETASETLSDLKDHLLSSYSLLDRDDI